MQKTQKFDDSLAQRLKWQTRIIKKERKPLKMTFQKLLFCLACAMPACGFDPHSEVLATQSGALSTSIAEMTHYAGESDKTRLVDSSLATSRAQPEMELVSFLDSSCSPGDVRDCNVCAPSRAFDVKNLNEGGQRCNSSGSWGICLARRVPVQIKASDARWSHPGGYRSGDAWIWNSSSPGGGQILAGPFQTLPPGRYSIHFRGRAWTQTISNSALVAQVYDAATGDQLASDVWVDVVLWPAKGRGANIDILLRVDVPEGCHELEMRATAGTNSTDSWVGLDSISIEPT